jgi:putative multicomponent Na+:H+ antiporter subunit B
MNDFYLPLIVALLPLVACLLVVQVNPYHALVIRGVLGAVAALVDALLGAADVALTEALVGTMLAITLYGVAVRSSLVLRLGVVKEESSGIGQLMDELHPILDKRYLRLELIPYSNSQALYQALLDKEVHATCSLSESSEKEKPTYHTQTRIQRIYDILHRELSLTGVTLTYVTVSDSEEKH